MNDPFEGSRWLRWLHQCERSSFKILYCNLHVSLYYLSVLRKERKQGERPSYSHPEPVQLKGGALMYRCQMYHQEQAGAVCVFPCCSIHVVGWDADLKPLIGFTPCWIMKNWITNFALKIQWQWIQPVMNIIFWSSMHINPVFTAELLIQSDIICRQKLITNICHLFVK